MQPRYRLRQLQQLADSISARSSHQTRHKCFVSYHAEDMDEVEGFIEKYSTEFIPRCIGITEEDDFVNSTDDEYIKRRIREKYLSDSTVTIVLLGECTWARRFVDWEISSSLRNDPKNKRSGVLVMPLPSMNNRAKLPARIADNYIEGDTAKSYTLYHSYPSTKSALRSSIQSAFDARSDSTKIMKNSRDLSRRNKSCP